MTPLITHDICILYPKTAPKEKREKKREYIQSKNNNKTGQKHNHNQRPATEKLNNKFQAYKTG